MIGIISDTHWPPGSSFVMPSKRKEREKSVQDQIKSVFMGSEFIIHAGDVGEESIVYFLESIAPLYIVRGNRDPLKVAGRELPKFLILEYKNRIIGVTHGSGSPKRIIERSVNPLLLSHKPDIIIFGHTHRKFMEWRENRLYINPGSAGDTFFAKENWIATLDIINDKPEVHFFQIKIT